MLELLHVTKSFNLTGAAEDERIALDNVSLQIKPGEFITIIGGNGSGKSTTLNIVSGSLNPDKGKVLLNGFDVSKIPEYKTFIKEWVPRNIEKLSDWEFKPISIEKIEVEKKIIQDFI